ncbi:MAG TPA: TetR/AcrR family transcriptional regulator [Steroidobacteraceae bacterium]|nr:TetR/AcrR family transcriptional regulator [Steroidobacteraceae bacterium]
MKVKRRMAPENAATRGLLMDAVESLMRTQGYGAVSARAVAALTGLKYPTIFYYFETMDDLLITTYRRRTRSVLERTQAALESESPLHALWSAAADPFDAALSLEYMALSNHNELIRAETIVFGERMRRVVADRLSERLRRASPDIRLFTPFGITLGLTSLGGLLGFESALGISGGHKEIKLIVDWIVRRLEGEDRSVPVNKPRLPAGRRSSEK